MVWVGNDSYALNGFRMYFNMKQSELTDSLTYTYQVPKFRNLSPYHQYTKICSREKETENWRDGNRLGRAQAKVVCWSTIPVYQVPSITKVMWYDCLKRLTLIKVKKEDIFCRYSSVQHTTERTHVLNYFNLVMRL